MLGSCSNGTPASRLAVLCGCAVACAEVLQEEESEQEDLGEHEAASASKPAQRRGPAGLLRGLTAVDGSRLLRMYGWRWLRLVVPCLVFMRLSCRWGGQGGMTDMGGNGPD